MATLADKPPETGTAKSKRVHWIAKVLISAAWLVVLLEVAPRFLLATNLFSHYRIHRALLGWDESSWRINWVYLHRTNEALPREYAGEHPTLGWTGTYSQYHPARGWTLAPKVKQMTAFGPGKFVRSNSKGLRGMTEYEYARTPGKQRILSLGDSFAFGMDVSDDETYSHYLESILLNTEVLNLGVQGYAHDQMLLYLKEEGLKYHPDVVIVGFVWPDIYRNLWNFFAFAKPKFVMTAGGLRLTGVPVPTPEYVLEREPYRSKAVDVGVILQNKVEWALGINERKARELTRRILDEIAATSRSIGAVPVFVYLPVDKEIIDPSSSRSEHEQYLYDYCSQRNVACLFLRPRFAKEIQKGAKLDHRFHWKPNIHEIAAEEIAAFLVARGLVRPSTATPTLMGVNATSGAGGHRSP